ncbi:kelch-like protein 21 [Branchiostoma floridae]|uniref:Kelch-like protein 21 n=1 Tax=Branchiostoma floridae TaxID=7739 RepID=A0A9J7KW10_BRAFL|nr:kelch-like protein 21 [Branchiostoma floridae]XP_035671355.1 kelch-like protein 21 [Branchiostoma floridae]XP_035671357.1 kelch-like protein 21 [Branchiostoma floridae]XP_035671358.1 kelch-like protein 21 [Branchiostoma floridae]
MAGYVMNDVSCAERSSNILHVFNSAGELFLEHREHFSKVSSALKEENARVSLNGERCACENKTCCHGNELSVLNEWRATGTACDVILCAEEEEFPCHRAVLAASSLYFRLLLLGDFRERLEEKVRLEDVTPGTLRLLLDYSYTGRIRITADNVEDLVHASGLLQFPDVTDACCRYLTHNLRPDNCVQVMKLAEDYFLTELSEYVKKFAFENLPAIFVTSDFAQGSLRDDQNVLKLLKQAMSVARDRCSCLQ